ncbi:MAG: T9SS type A sorting domain-containing protein [Bacteroidetes bacterium]|nr:T9SS type A sorting domain-containing protein [Bacteroidota bacterium]
MKKIILLAAAVIMTVGALKSQIVGTIVVPSVPYPTIASAVTALNTQSISGNVFVDITAGYTETAPFGGYSLTVSGSAGNTLTFEKSGVGANPQIVAYTGTATPGSALQDGLFRLIGSDYVTFDGIDLFDGNSTNPATMEFGFGFFRASATDGCQNNTIKNCFITLNKINNAIATAPAVDGSRGIDLVNALSSTHTTPLTITSASGANSNNKFYKNTIQNCNIGIAIIGYAALSPFTAADQNNDIGGLSSATSNTIINFGGAAGATNAAAGIRTLAQYNLNVSYNLINNNNGAGANHVTTLRGIYVNSATSANATISNNTITVSGAGTTTGLTGIENASGSTSAGNTININNNLIQNCAYTTATTGLFNGILNSGSATNVNINGNLISNLNYAGTGTGVLIETGSPVNATANSNTITGITRTGASGFFRIIKTSSPTSFVANGNLVDGVNWSATTSTGGVDCIYSLSAATGVTVTNNVIRNVSLPTTGIGNGIREGASAGAKVIQGNQIYNFTTTAGGAGGATFNGIYCSVGNLDISTNTVYALNSTGTTGGTGGVINGIQIAGGTTNNIYKNRIFGLSSTSSGPLVSGVLVSSGTNNTIYNNLIGDLRATAANVSNAVIGINLTGGITDNVYFNTAYLNATSSGALFGTSALFAATVPNLNLRNNILVNTSAFTGAGLTVAYRRSNTTLTTYSSTSNNNLFYAGTPGASNVIFNDGTASQQTIAAFKAFVSPRDNNSVTENPTFVSTVGINPNFLNINTGTPTQIESGATSVTGITDDYAGTIRNISTPDIGAWEGNYVINDMLAPNINGVGFTSSLCNLSGRTFTAVISDGTGVATGTLSPRVYYKVNGNPYASSQGTLTSGTALNGVWTFSMAYTAVITDVISYFIIAQDASPANNLTSNPSSGLVATDVNNVTTPPATPLTYTVSGTLNGVYTVGATGNYTTLSAAANAYNTSCLSGPVTFQLIDPSYSTAETFPIVFLNNTDASSTNSLLVVPFTGLGVSITATNTATSVFKFLNARFITVDGLNNGGSSLAVNSTNSLTSANIWLASSGTGNTDIAIKNLVLTGGSFTSTTSFGIISGIDGANPSTTGGADNDNISIQGNSILKAYYGIYANGTSPVNAGGLNNWSITTNSIGPVTAGVNNIGFSGIYLQNMLSVNVSTNVINNVVTSASSNGGIYLLSNINGVTVAQNTITNISTSATGSGANSTCGIYFGLNAINGLVSKNTLSSISNSNVGGWGARGIILSTNVALSNIKIENNMISDVYTYSDPLAAYWPIGIALEGSTGGVNIDYNTISLFGSHPGLTTATGSSPIYINTGSTGGLKIRDNIFSNTYDNTSSTTDNAYAIYSTVTSANFVAIDYNDYYVGGTGNVQTLGFLGGAQNTLLNLQAAFGQNANSKNVIAVFTATNDLHLVPASNVPLDNLGTPLAGIATDIDNQTRNVTTPDMGADEFTSPVCTTANGGTITPASYAVCAGQTLAISSNSASTGINTVYQWMYSLTSGGTYTNVGGGTGANTTSYVTPTLSAGVYYMVLQTQCTSASLTAISNEATITVNTSPTVVVSPGTGSICSPGTSSVNLTASGATTYSWLPVAGLSATTGISVNALPLTSTIYTVTGTTSGCNGSSTATISVLEVPSLVSLSATPTVVCAGGSSSLQANGALTTSYSITSIAYSAITTPSAGVTTLCNNGSTVIPLTAGSLDDGYWSNQTLPFAFNFFGSTYSTFVASTNGAIFLGSGNPATTTGYGVAMPSVSAGKPSIGAVYADLNMGIAASGSKIQYFTMGTSPNQKFVINWSGPFYSNSGTVTTQAILFESSNIIEVHTFTSTGTNAAVEGIQNGTGTTAFVVTGRNAVTWPVTTPDAYRWSPNAGTVTYNWSPSTFLSANNIANPTASNITSPITYSVIITAPNGCTNSGTQNVAVNALPVVTITSPTAICTGGTVNLTAGGANTYSWSTGSTSVTITDTPTIVTSYTVTGTNTLTGCSNNTIQSVAINTLPVVSVSGTNSVCAGLTASLTASGASTYTWNTSATTSSISITPSVTTSYTVSGTNANGCSNSAVQTVTVNNLPAVAISGSSAVCSGNPANLTASGATSYTWNTGATTTTIAPTPSVNVAYTVTGTDANNCINTATQAVTVNPNPTVTVAGGAICPGGSFTLAPTGAATYTYLPGGPVVSPASTTAYTVSGTNSFGCVTQTAVTAIVTVTNNLSVSITGSTSICNGQPASLTANGASTYSWNTGASTSTIAPTPSVNTTYSVTGASGSCSNTAVVTVTVNALPAVSLSASSSTLCDNGQTITLTGSPAGGAYSGFNVTGNMFTSTTAGTFTPVYSFTNSTTGCSNSANTSLVVSVCTAISKNASGLTDVRVYPNPNSGQFTIELNNGAAKYIEISDLTGRIIFSQVSSDDHMTISLADYANGVYFAKIQSNNSVEVVRVIKQ